MKRWKKWVIGVALLPMVLVLLALVLLYLPPVQRFAKDKAAAYAATTLGMDVSVGRVSLRFPLSLVVADAYVSDDVDTVLYVRELVVDIPLAPLLRQCVEVDAVELHDAKVKSKTLIPFYYVEGNIDNLRLESHGVDLRGSRAVVDELVLRDTRVDLCITDTAAADTTPSEPLDWVVEVKRVNIENVAFDLSMPLDTLSLTSGLDRAVVEDCVADLGAQSYSLRHFELAGGRFGMATGGEETPGVFNPSDLLAEGVSLEVDSAVYTPSSLRAVLTGIAAREKCGLAVISGGGRIESDDQNIYVKGLGLRTAASSIDINASAGWGLLDSVPAGAVSLDAAMSVAPADMEHFAGKLHGQIPRDPVTVGINLGGTLDRLDLSRLDVGWCDAVTLHAEGQVDCPLDSIKRSARLELMARTGDLDFVKPALGMADTAPAEPAPEPEDDEPQQASVTLFPKQMNFLYAGISNPLEIFDGGHAGASLQLSTDNGRIARTKGGWTLSGARTGQATVTVKAGGQTVGTRRFTVRELPEPTAAISYTAGGRRHTYGGRTPVSKNHLTANPQLTAAYEGDFIDVSFRVVRFHTLFINADKSVVTLEARGNRFTRQQIQKIQQLRRGEKFYVSSIVVSGPDGREREIEPIEALVI